MYSTQTLKLNQHDARSVEEEVVLEELCDEDMVDVTLL